jgi:sulfite reductase beta subunit-like hemoprotein
MLAERGVSVVGKLGLRDARNRIASSAALAPSPVRLAALACPALPTCPLAITEAERVLPQILNELDAELAALGLAGEKINVRITGCPNGCARPYTAEIAFIGRGPNKYNIHIGGSPAGTALNALWRESVPLAELIPTLRPLLHDFAQNRRLRESFGTFAARTAF